MNLTFLKEEINKRPQIKKWFHCLIMNPKGACPRNWVKYFINPFFLKYGKGTIIRKSVIMNVSPINFFSLGDNSIIEYFSILDNGGGAIYIGNNSRIGLRNTIISLVHIGNQVILAQNVVISGLNHNYKDISTPIKNKE